MDELPEKSCIQKDEDELLFVEIENNQKQKIPNTEEARLTERISKVVYQIEEEIYETEKEICEAEREIHETGKGMFEAKREGKTCASPQLNPKIKNIQSSRISTEQLDKLMNLVGELVINRSRIKELTGNLKSKELELALFEFYKLTRELQEEVIDVRMVPLDHITYIYPRMVRDLARAQNKEIDFIIKGKEIKLDRTILEEIGDSLVHLLRNAVDHGIEVPERRAELGKKETGTILITALRQENVALIKIEDDGCGIDTEEIRKVALKKELSLERRRNSFRKGKQCS
ncbi:MAG: ATP-binding protein [Methanosarcina barkeri]|nr:ATP-binding protein [Methanosarcina sp. ERenArc_MAG2]